MNVWTFFLIHLQAETKVNIEDVIVVCQYVLQMLFAHLGGGGCVDCESVLIRPAS